MKLFENLPTENLEAASDSVGFEPIQSDIYDAIIQMVYADESQRGAQCLVVTYKLAESGREFTETYYVTNREGKPYYEANGKKHPLPSFTMMNDLSLVATEKELTEQPFDEKLVEIYNFDLKKKLPTPKPVAVDLIGKHVAIAVVDVEEPKRAQVDGEWRDTTDTVRRTKVEKVLDLDTHKTVVEATRGSEATYWDKWLERNKGKTRVIKPKNPVDNSSSSTVFPAAGAQRQSKGLFSK